MIRLLLAVVALAIGMPAHAGKTLIVNANGYTLDSSGSLTRFQMLLVGDDGKLLATLPHGAREPKLAPGDYRLDARGRTLLPGLIDAHGHIMELGFGLRRLDLAPAADLADAQARIAAHGRANAASTWVLGRGWSHARWGLDALPKAADLDAIMPTRPVWLESQDGHAGWANSVAMKAAGITRATKDPPGGRIVRDEAGNPTGIFVDAAKALMNRVVPPVSAGEMEKSFEAALGHLAMLGVTGVHDMGVSPDAWALYRAFADKERLTVRITAYAAGMAAMEAISPLRPTPWLYQDRLRLQGIKFCADGASGSRSAWLLKSCSGEPVARGLQIPGDARMKNLFSRANFLGYQVAAHAVGDAANRQALDSFAEIRPTYGDGFRNRIEHAQIVDAADIPRFAELGIIASIQPAHATSDRTMAEGRLGAQRLEGACAWSALRGAGARLALGSGFPANSANPFHGMQAAVTRKDRNGQPPGGWRPDQAMTLHQAFAGFTLDAAHAGLMENRVGTLEAGRWADFVLLDRDPFSIPPMELQQVVVEETWLAGRRVFVRQP